MVSKAFFNPSEDHYEFVKEKHKEKWKRVKIELKE